MDTLFGCWVCPCPLARHSSLMKGEDVTHDLYWKTAHRFEVVAQRKNSHGFDDNKNLCKKPQNEK